MFPARPTKVFCEKLLIIFARDFYYAICIVVVYDKHLFCGDGAGER
jgi:hypothetical protein